MCCACGGGHENDWGSGGADGCTNMEAADNAGLSACLVDGEHGHSLRDVYHGFSTQVSLADFIVIAAEAVMATSRGFVSTDAGESLRASFKNAFRYGRTTATSCVDAEKLLPDPERGCAAVEDTFVKNMGLSWGESAALMGVHTIGKASVNNSGYAGRWSNPQASRLFNNDYFVSLVTKGWRPLNTICGNDAKNAWYMAGPGFPDVFPPEQEHLQMMLNTDLCLAYSANVSSASNCCAWQENAANDSANGTKREQLCWDDLHMPDCGSTVQLDGSAGADVKQFAEDEAKWLEVFLQAWDKATSNGIRGLTPLNSFSTCPTSDDDDYYYH
jgi:catalase (peroxidase I)